MTQPQQNPNSNLNHIANKHPCTHVKPNTITNPKPHNPTTTDIHAYTNPATINNPTKHYTKTRTISNRITIQLVSKTIL